MKVAILGAGAIAFTNAMVLSQQGHEPILWSPSGRRTVRLAAGEPLRATGAVAGSCMVGVAGSAREAVTGADAVVVAVDAAGHRPVLEAAAPHLRSGQPVIISAAYALAALHLSRATASRGITLPIISWSATIGTAHQESLTEVTIRLLRPRIDMAALGEIHAAEGIDICRRLFGDRFRQRQNALEIALLANSNPVFHVPVTLMNLARVERGEAWVTYEQTTPSISRIVEGLDAERIAVGAAYGFSIETVNEHFHHSFGVPLGSMAAMMSSLFQRGLKPKGAASTTHRHLSQDIPWGLAFTARIGDMAAIDTPLHDAVVSLASTALGPDFGVAGLPDSLVTLDGLTREDILSLSCGGT